MIVPLGGQGLKDDAGGRPWWMRRWPTVATATALVLVAVGPIVISAFAGLGRDWYPAGDWAVLELRTRDVGSSSTPLIGPYSRFGWNHPGPLLFWLFAVPYRLSGSASGAMLFGAGMVNVAAVVLAAVFLWRRGRLPLVAGYAAMVAVLVSALGPAFVRDPWNPSVAVLPVLALVVLAWSAVDGDGPALPLFVLVGSFLVQSHVGFALLVAALGAWALVWFIRARRRAVRPPWRPLLVAGAVALAVWLPVAIDQVGDTGNAAEVVEYFSRSDAAPAGLVRSLGIAAQQMGDVAPWQGGRELVSTQDGSLVGGWLLGLVVPVGAFALAGLLAWRRGATDALAFQGTVLVAVVAATASVSRITGPIYNYLVRWWWVLALLWWLAILWAVWAALVRDGPRARGPLTGAAVVASLCVLAVFGWRTTSAVDRVGTPDGEWYVTIEALTPDAVRQVPDEGPLLVRGYGSRDGSVADGLRLQLERAGFDVVVDDEHLHKYGSLRRVPDGGPAHTVWVVTGAAVADFDGRDDMVRIAWWDPFDVDERAAARVEADALAAQFEVIGRHDLVEALGSGGTLDPARGLAGVDQELLDSVERVRRDGDPVSVYLGRPDAGPPASRR